MMLRSRSAAVAVHPGRLIPLLGLLAVLGPLTIDLYLPAFPLLQDDLAATASSVQLTLTAATLGFAIGQLAVGPWSDAVGRRTPLLVATTVHVLASAAIAGTPDMGWMLALRIVQGIGAAGGAVVATAMIRDVSTGSSLVRGLARIALFTGIAPIIAPFIGAQLMLAVDWRGLFVAVAAYGLVVLLLAAWSIPETLPRARRTALHHTATGSQGYRMLLTDRSFIGVALIGGLMVSAVFANLSTSAFVLQERFGMNAQQFGLISALNGIAFVVGTQLAAITARRILPGRILSMTLPSMAGLGFTLALTPLFDTGPVAAVVVVAGFMLLAGACAPCLGVLALADHGETAGTAAALVGAANYGLAGLASPLVGALGISTFGPLGVVMGVIMGASVVLFWMFVHRHTAIAYA